MPEKYTAIIIPVYNEASSMYGNLPYISRMFTPLNKTLEQGIVQEIIWVDDGSTDNTANLVEKAIKGDTHRLYRLETNRGKALAFMTGLRNSSDADIVMTLDGDFLDLTPEKINSLISYLTPDLDMVISRYSQNGYKCLEFSGLRVIRKKALRSLIDPDHEDYFAWRKVFSYNDSTSNNIESDFEMALKEVVPEKDWEEVFSYGENIGNNIGFGLEVALNEIVAEDKTKKVDEIPFKSREPGRGASSMHKITMHQSMCRAAIYKYFWSKEE